MEWVISTLLNRFLKPTINSLQGIHNEPGVKRGKIPSITVVVANVLKILEISALEKSRPIATMVNNLGGLSILELHTIADEVMGQLETAGFDIQRTLVGTFATSLDGPGFSVTILTLDPLTKSLLNCPTTVPAWPNLIEAPTLGTPGNTSHKLVNALAVEKTLEIHINAEKEYMVEAVLLHKILDAVLESVTRDEPQITRYDTIAGDGDCGETLLKGVNCKQIPPHAINCRRITLPSTNSNIVNSAICRALKNSSPGVCRDIVSIFKQIANTIESSMGGTSGAIYAIFFNAMVNNLSSSCSSSDNSKSLGNYLRAALNSALTELYRYTSARKGHRTLMDALIPFVTTFSGGSTFEVAVIESRKGAESTRKLDALLGRASYVSKEMFEREGGIPDPGAMGVVSVLHGIMVALVD